MCGCKFIIFLYFDKSVWGDKFVLCIMYRTEIIEKQVIHFIECQFLSCFHINKHLLAAD